MGGVLQTNNNAVITAAKSPFFWEGIVAYQHPNPSQDDLYDQRAGAAFINHTIVSYAKNAFSNYNPNTTPAISSGGLISGIYSKWENNLRSIRLYNETRGGNPTTLGPPATPTGANLNARFQYCTFSLTSNFEQSAGYNEMVYVNNCKTIAFWSCHFKGNKYTFANGKAAIRGVNSSISLQRFPNNLNAPKPTVISFAEGVIMANSLQPLLRQIIYRTTFGGCKNAVNLSGCANAFIVENIIHTGENAAADYNGIFMRNCTGYRVEGNQIQYDGYDPYQYNGIIAMNSGTANNTIYRNTINGCKLDLQAIGTNKAPGLNPATGLKFLCNTVADAFFEDHYEISAMQDPAGGNANNGIHGRQYVQGFVPSQDRSAANIFTDYYSTVPAQPRNYFLGANTNDFGLFRYKYNPAAIYNELPKARNFNDVAVAPANTCPIVNTIDPVPIPPKLNDYKSRLQELEKSIGNIENKENPDEEDHEQLGYLYQEQSSLIDSMVNYYVENDLLDSLALIYEQVSKGQHYQLMLASTYVALNRYEDAIALLNNLPENYALTEEETLQAFRLAYMYKVLQCLAGGSIDSCIGAHPEYTDSIQTYAAEDAMYAGAIARTILANFAGYYYNPVYVMPASIVRGKLPVLAQCGDMLYPNPATTHLQLNWEAAAEGAVLILTNVMGQAILNQSLQQGYNNIDIVPLAKGIYFAQIKQGNRILLQQKIVKQ